MKSFLVLLFAFVFAAPAAFGQANNQNNQPLVTGKPPSFFVSLRQKEKARKEAAWERVRQHRADRAAEQEKLYQDWHDRYVADAPVREEFHRTRASAYLAEASYAQERAAYINARYGPQFVPVVPLYAPANQFQFPAQGNMQWNQWGW